MNTRRSPGTAVLSTRAATLKFIYVLIGSFVLSYALVPTATVQAQRREMPLTLREATAFALQGNLEIQIAGLNPPIRAAQITEREGIFDLNTRATLRATDARTLETATAFLKRVNGHSLARMTPRNSAWRWGLATDPLRRHVRCRAVRDASWDLVAPDDDDRTESKSPKVRPCLPWYLRSHSPE